MTSRQSQGSKEEPPSAVETGRFGQALEDIKLCTKDEPLAAAENKKIEETFKDVLRATDEFAGMFEGSEGHQQMGEKSKISEESNLRQTAQKETMSKQSNLPGPSDPAKITFESAELSRKIEMALEQILQLLQSPDDTTKFIALALLRGALTKIDSKEVQDSYRAIAPKCWTAMPVSFLDRLFNQFTKMVKGDASAPDARPMFELAFNVTHAFVCLLSPPENRHALLPKNMSKQLTASWAKRVEYIFGLLDRPLESPLHDPSMQILQLFSDIPEGASILIGVKDWVPLLKHADKDERPLEIYVRTFSTLAKTKRGKGLVSLSLLKKSFNKSVNRAIPAIQEVNREEKLWDAINQIIVTINDPEVKFTPGLELKKPPTWYPKIIAQIRRSPHIKRNKREVRTEAVLLAMTLLNTYHAIRLAGSLFIPYSDPENKVGGKPQTYDFVIMLVSEITQSVTEYDKLSKQSDEYSEETVRLKAFYELLGCFIVHLIGREYAGTPQNPVKPLLPPDLLLILRKLISELMQTSILTIRERFGPSGTAIKLRDPVQEARWKFPWTMVHLVTRSQLRAMSMWLREDDGDKLRKEAASITDVLLQLLVQGEELEVANEVMMCLEGISRTPAGTKSFLALGGWQILTKELERIVMHTDTANITDTHLGEQIAIVLYNILYSTGASPPKATTAKTLEIIVSVEQNSTQRSRLQLELLSLADMLLEKMAPAQRKQYAKVTEKIFFKASALYNLGGPTKDAFQAAMINLTKTVPIPGISM